MLADYRLDMERRGLTPTSVKTVIYRLLALQRWMVDHDPPLSITDATEDDIQDFLDTRSISSRSRYAWLSSLHGFYVWAMRTGRTSFNPVADIARPRLRRTLPRPIPDADLAHALAESDAEMRAWLTLMAYAGLRCAEVARLRVEDVRADEQMLHIIGKGRHERWVPKHPLVMEALRAHGLGRRGYVFIRPQGGPFPPARVSRLISVYFTSIGVDATAHQLRHWYATRLYAVCKDIRVVQESLGHQDPKTTAIYTAFRREDAIAAVLALKEL